VPLHLFLLEFFSPLFPCHSLILFSQGTKKELFVTFLALFREQLPLQLRL
jgi:hypothetical protein